MMVYMKSVVLLDFDLSSDLKQEAAEEVSRLCHEDFQKCLDVIKESFCQYEDDIAAKLMPVLQSKTIEQACAVLEALSGAE